MSISTDVAAVARLASIRKRSAGLSGGRIRRLLLMAAVAPVAYAVGARRSAVLAHSQVVQLAELQRRLEKLESAAGCSEPEQLFSDRTGGEVSAAEKERIASHYEILANQLAHEERLRDIGLRLAAVERVAPVTTTNS